MNTYQAILTKFLPPTNYRGARIKAWCQAGSVTIDDPPELSGLDCHAEAVRQLCAKIDARCVKEYGEKVGRWSEKAWIAGAFPHNGRFADYAFVDAETDK
jgi:hypothetical protein